MSRTLHPTMAAWIGAIAGAAWTEKGIRSDPGATIQLQGLPLGPALGGGEPAATQIYVAMQLCTRD